MLVNSWQELSRRTTECGRLQERSLALAKELAALKLYAYFLVVYILRLLNSLAGWCMPVQSEMCTNICV
jgi:hypothetical protein